MRLSESKERREENRKGISGRGRPGGKEVGKGGGRPGGRKWEREEGDQDKGSGKDRKRGQLNVSRPCLECG